ncbi:hypothetical protein LMG31506_03121 [Cupriavidus yeoncheonensis]|uniref:Transmembrane lipoprotein n=1 Tax=Cupriavidus yeoncheonensis TaxID=1462994 RepID=A0A916N4U2_9BURK|nr:hypothetical protein [Cupriavidus yeoncheonensis]CAG2145025.1 hypothetical protein LMG31506_03121 [Cupriavidus yeoncheonensis]
MEAFAVLLGLVAAACIYLAAPNQVLLPSPQNGSGRRPAPQLFGWLGLALTVLSTWLWSQAQGWPVAVAANLAIIPTGLSLWPFIGTYVNQGRPAAKRQA